MRKITLAIVLLAFSFGYSQNASQGSTNLESDRASSIEANDINNNISKKFEIQVFPNPTKSVWNIKSNVVMETINVYDVLGKQVISKDVHERQTALNASNLSQGLYVAKIKTDRGFNTIRLVRQ